MRPIQVVGRGTWLDQVAARVIGRERRLNRSLHLVRTETGFSASGVPHVGTAGEALRPYGIKLALEEQGVHSELIAFSDDMDGLRKVPAGLPSWLSNHICHPVSEVPDPEGCHRSYAEHMTYLLQQVLDRVGAEYRLHRASEVYKSGLLSPQIRKILENSSRIGRKAAEILGQTKFLEVLPYFPVCANCGRVYVARAHRYVAKEEKVLYRCEGETVGRKWVKGCGYEGEADPTKAPGKLSWKGEFAARWQALDIRFEAYGKDLLDSVRLNDWISDEILGHHHPYHVRFEHFVSRGGGKLSKSAGIIVTPMEWLRYGTPQSLLLLLFKRIKGTRPIGIEDVFKYMEEYDRLEELYFGKRNAGMKTTKLRGLYEYANLLKPPQMPTVHMPHSLLVELAMIAPRDKVEEYVLDRLKRYGTLRGADAELLTKIRLATNWAQDRGRPTRPEAKLSEQERKAVKTLASVLPQERDAGALQNRIFEIARTHGLEPKSFFKTLYMILLGSESGPRLGPYLWDIGVRGAAETLMKAAGKTKSGTN